MFYLKLQYQTKSSAKESEAYNMVGKHAEEVLKSVKTVVAFGGEHKETHRYILSNFRVALS